MVGKLEDLSKDPDVMSYYDEQKLEEMAQRLNLEEARKEGHSSGFEEGQKTKTLETAKKMLEEGITISLVSKITGLSKEELEKLL